MFHCVFVTFLYGFLGQVWYLVVSIPDLCLLTHFNALHSDGSYIDTISMDLSILYFKGMMVKISRNVCISVHGD